MAKGFESVNLHELLGAIGLALGTGAIRFLALVRKGRGRFRWFDLFLEPLLALMGGMVVWLMNEVAETPDLMQAAMTCVGAWAGARVLHFMELKMLGGSRADDRRDAPPPESDDDSIRA